MAKKLSKETKIKLFLGLSFVVLVLGYVALKITSSEGNANDKTKTSLGAAPTISDKTQKQEYEVASKDITASIFRKEEVDAEKTDTTTVKAKKKSEPAAISKKGKAGNTVIAAAAAERKSEVTVRVVREEPKVQPLPEKPKKKIYFVIVKEDDFRSPVSSLSKKEEENQDPKQQVKLFKAKIYGTQKLKTNETVIVRNTEDVIIGSKRIPEGSIFYGTTSINGNRMYVNIHSAMTPMGSIGLALSLYDSDYSKGIFLKETMDIQVEQSNDQLIDNSLTFVNPAAQIVGTVAKETGKQVQRALTRQNKVSVVLEDSYDVMIAVPLKPQM